MTLTIDLPDNLEAALKARALAHGLSEAGYVRSMLERDLAHTASVVSQPSTKKKNLVELFKPLRGLNIEFDESEKGIEQADETIPSSHAHAPFANAEEKARAFEAWARSQPFTPPLSNEAVQRENLVRDA